MRFAYIDSQGNEVDIPSVDALALRIELGVITENTDLYDGQADRWGPAHTHEIFHTLSRTAEEEGFVAPPPAVAPPPTPEAPAAEEPVPEEPQADQPVAHEPVADEPVAEETPEPIEAPAEEPAADDALFDFGGGLEFEDDTTADAAPPADDGDSDPLGIGDDLGLKFSDTAEEPAETAEEPAETTEEPAETAEEAAETFDFGAFSGGLEVEGGAGAEEEVQSAGDAMDFGGDMETESPMDFAGGMELETPMSDFSAEDPPSWTERDGPGGADSDPAPDDGAIEFESPPSPAASPAHAPSSSADEDEPRERPKPKSRPSPPRRPKKGLPVGAIAGVVAVLVVGAGGWFVFQRMGLGQAASVDDVPALPPVVIPDIPAELLPQMRDLAEDAIAEMLDDLRGRSGDLDIPLQPRQEWLGGNYLGNASEFDDIEQFWLGIERFVDEVRSTDTRLFHEKYVAQVAAAGIAQDTGDMLTERADSGFVAARDGRVEAYNLMDDLVNAALDLHQFLVDNEVDIAYEPVGAGVSRDPVLEAVPATEALGDEMWGLVDGITGALMQMGTLDIVTTERLFAVLFDRIRRAGIE